MVAQQFCQLIWRKFACSRSELRLDITLKCGQSFRWKAEQLEDETIYAGVLFNKLVLLKQDESFLHYSDPSGCLDETALQTYLNLDVDLQTLYQAWSKVDPIFLEIGKKYPGVRMLRQDPVENLFSFICSANNNISRISGMVENMAKEYGDKVCEFEGVEYHSFPKLESLSGPGVEDKLRELGFGYRAKYIQLSAQKILELGGEEWLHGLRKLKYAEAKEKLLSLSGIGPKQNRCPSLVLKAQEQNILGS
ncbi:N-glycosylase/DNA lyase [Eurytemora carolleeae]|uniref:N-glycosylase/DNA lyase n=1 Tax=Eurytemora carolleeae TaxID=1294199 RepID=UPI000C785E60|nr:N-glycosylase/DNA lyase [Eurytemora carolleeae]|eukprot:XP_023346327.1 N-glycosylase/DNA lyase-like [Eurytemora affinis]